MTDGSNSCNSGTMSWCNMTRYTFAVMLDSTKKNSPITWLDMRPQLMHMGTLTFRYEHCVCWSSGKCSLIRGKYFIVSTHYWHWCNPGSPWHNWHIAASYLASVHVWVALFMCSWHAFHTTNPGFDDGSAHLCFIHNLHWTINGNLFSWNHITHYAFSFIDTMLLLLLAAPSVRTYKKLWDGLLQASMTMFLSVNVFLVWCFIIREGLYAYPEYHIELENPYGLLQGPLQKHFMAAPLNTTSGSSPQEQTSATIYFGDSKITLPGWTQTGLFPLLLCYWNLCLCLYNSNL